MNLPFLHSELEEQRHHKAVTAMSIEFSLLLLVSLQWGAQTNSKKSQCKYKLLSPDFNKLLSPDYNKLLSPNYNLLLSPDYNKLLSPDYNKLLSPDYNKLLSS